MINELTAIRDKTTGKKSLETIPRSSLTRF